MRKPELLSPEFLKILGWVDKARTTPMHELGAEVAREHYERVGGNLDHRVLPSDHVESLSLDLPCRTLHALLISPTALYWADPKPVLLYFHGGGFTVGSSKTHLGVCAHLARLSDCAILSVDYRLAPEAVFPAPVDDAWESLLWLRTHAASLGLDASRMAVGGDSAGGTLAAATALHARDQGIELQHQLLIYPGVGHAADFPSHHTYASGYLLERDTILWFFRNLIPDFVPGHGLPDWRFAPLLHECVEGCAPTSMVIASADPLYDEGLAYADHLRAAQVPCEVHVAQGAIHGFWQMGSVSAAATTAQAWAAERLQLAFSTNR